MSDTPQGADWWLASDGRWYPPQSRPAPPPPPPPPLPPTAQWQYPGAYAPAPFFAGPRSLSSTLGGWLQGMYWASAALLAVGTVLFALTAVQFQTYWTSSGDGTRRDALDAWVDMEDAAATVFGLAVFTWIAVFVLMIIWMNKAHKVTSELWRGPRSWSSGWTVGGWFIPLANFVIPKMVLLEIERIAASTDERGNVAPTWRSTSSSAIGWLYWIPLTVGLIVFQAAAALSPDTFRMTEQDADLIVASYVLQSIGLLLWAVGSMFGALHVRDIGRRLSRRAIEDFAARRALSTVEAATPARPPAWG